VSGSALADQLKEVFCFFSKKQTFLIAPYRYRHRHHNNGDPNRQLV
jgi:hypothetical protein